MTNRLLMIDVSSNNGRVDVRALHQAGYRAIAVKATEGNSYVNPYYAATVDQAHQLGMRVVHYHFPTAHSSALVEAEHFLATVRSHVRTRLDELTLDMETIISGQQWQPGQAKTYTDSFLHLLWDKAPRVGLLRRRVRRVVYGPPYFLRDNKIRPQHGEGLWVASLGGSEPVFIPPGWRTWRFWQFTWTAHVPGVTGNVDESHIRPSVLRVMRVYPTLRFGATGQAVSLLQHLLRDRAGYKALHVTGTFDGATRDAVRDLKRRRKFLPVNGVAGPRVWRYLARLPKES